MKKNYYFLLLLLCSSLFSFAQPVVTASDFANFTATAYDVPDFVGITQGSSGPNQTWDYHLLVPNTDTAFYFSTVPVTTAPFYSSFPLANFCLKVSYTFNSVLYQEYSFVKITNTGTESYGTTNSTGIQTQYTDTQTSPLPLHYGDSYIDTYQRTTDSSPTTATTTYDGYGTLIIPYGTYSNVIRTKEVKSNYTQYNWYKIAPYTPLLTIEVNDSTGDVVSVSLYHNTTGLGVAQNSADPKIAVYPNPATKSITLQSPNNTVIERITITDMLGKTVLEANHYTDSIDVETLNSGLYLLQAFSNGQTFETKFVKQ